MLRLHKPHANTSIPTTPIKTAFLLRKISPLFSSYYSFQLSSLSFVVHEQGEVDNGDLVPFANFMARSVERALDIYLLAFEKEAELLTLAEVSKLTPHSHEYLSLLARKGDIGAFKLRRNWVIIKKGIR